MTDQRQEVFRKANELFGRQPDWATFFREVLGVEGVAHRAFPTPEQFAEFERSEEFGRIQQMLTKLRDNEGKQPGQEDNDAAVDGREPIRVITVRMPNSLHESLKQEAETRHTSMNKLCISKLLQVIDESMMAMEEETAARS